MQRFDIGRGCALSHPSVEADDGFGRQSHTGLGMEDGSIRPLDGCGAFAMAGAARRGDGLVSGCHAKDSIVTCPNRADGVHDCTGKDTRCACGWKMKVPRFGFSLDVHDNKTRSSAVDDGFMCDSADMIADALECAARKLRELR